MRTVLLIILIISIQFTSYSQFNILTCDVYGCSSTPPEWTATDWKINGDLQDYSGCGDPEFEPSIHLAIVDKDSCKAWHTDCGNGGNFFDQYNLCNVCRTREERYFIFRINDVSSMAKLDSVLIDPILNGQNLLMYSFNCTDFDFINATYPNTVQILQNLGFTGISTADSVRPFIYFAEAGNTSSAIEIYGSTTPGTLISLSVPLTNCATNGIDENNITFNIYPTLLRNGEMINIDFDEIKLFDLSGKLIRANYSRSNKYQISNLVPGIYILNIKKGNNFLTQKIAVVE